MTMRIFFRMAAFLAAIRVAAAMGDESAMAPSPGLVWREQTIRMTVMPEQSFEGECEFAATNTSSRAVKIKRVETSCGCTIAKPSTFEAPPGGVVKIVVAVKLGTGKFDPKTILVESDDPGSSIQTLRLEFDAVTRVAVSPEVLAIGKKEPPSILTVTPKTAEVRLVGVDSTDYSILPKLLPQASDGAYFVEVVDKGLGKASRAKIVLYFSGEKGERWEQTVSVKPAE